MSTNLLRYDRRKLSASERKDRADAILHAAVAEARHAGFGRFTREGVAKRAHMSPATVSQYVKTMAQLRRDVMRAAIRDELLDIVAQGIAARDPHAMKAPDELKRRAIESIM